jgi:hypothetical protein
MRIKIGWFCNSFVINELQMRAIAGIQRAFQDWKRSYTGFRSSITINPFFLTMKIKVRLARWLSLRIQEQTRKERRALRDYSRQELGRIRQAEIRSRGLRLYSAWSRRSVSKFASPVASEWPTPFERAA